MIVEELIHNKLSPKNVSTKLRGKYEKIIFFQEKYLKDFFCPICFGAQ